MRRSTSRAFTLVELPALRLRSWRATSGNKREAFTLVELLVVVAIIVILLAILIPGLEIALQRAEIAKCAANLDGIHTATFLYANDNQRKVFDCGRATVTICIDDKTWMGVDWPGVLSAYGLFESGKVAQPTGIIENEPSKIWNCPSRDLISDWDTVYYANQCILGYVYYGGVKLWKNPWRTQDSNSPRTLADPGYYVLVTDGTGWTYGSWGGGPATVWGGMPAHKARPNPWPAGQNQAYMDGSADWVNADKMQFVHSWNASNDERYYMYQRNFGGWNPPEDHEAWLKNKLKP